MVRCLVVDDDSDKVKQIVSLITREYGDGQVHVSIASSVYDAAALMRSNIYDLLVIDLNLPLRSGETPNEDGGGKLLRQIARGVGNLVRPSFVVGLTAFDNLAARGLPEFQSHGWSLVQYVASSSSWEETIANQCRHVADVKARYNSSNSNQSDVCICTALTDPELEAFSERYSCNPVVVSGDSSRYLSATINVAGISRRIVLGSASEMGNSGMAVLTTKMINTFRPKICLLAGICAGIRAEIGDVVVAESSLNYETGKWRESDETREAVFAPEPRYLPASPGIVNALRRFKSDKAQTILGIPAKFRSHASPKAPLLSIGPVACGAAVIENCDIINGLEWQNRKLEGLEMESYGFYLACRASYSGLEYVMIKAVCDRGRPPKEDRYQRYAAFLSAEICCEFIEFEMSTAGGILA